MTKRLLELIRRGLQSPPHVVFRWLVRHIRAEIDQYRAPARARRLTPDRLLDALQANSPDSLWRRLGEAPFPVHAQHVSLEDYEKSCPGDGQRIIAAAEAATQRRVDLLGSGPVELGRPIPWHKDFKSGHSWPVVPFRRLDLLDLDRDSDVKVPWELSRLQWLIPAGQAYLMTGDERYATAVREVIREWADANPLARGVNWACTMDVALRGMTMVWLFRVFHQSAAWRDEGFRHEFLKLLYLHGDFTSRHLEWSDVNGNHLLADAAGLVVMGLFFGEGGGPKSWQALGWRILEDELPKQVHADGVDFEASTAYHRLALELFLLPALYRRASGLDVAGVYSDRLRRMAAFIAAYSRADGSTPLWGDNDDGRVLPFGPATPEAKNDHRYLIAITASAFDDADLAALASGQGTNTAAEVFWTLGPEAAANLPAKPAAEGSRAFADGGVYIMRSDDEMTGGDHVFIDAGPVGFAGRGGHGHNDCLSFEATLLGVKLITDCGTYVYSADTEWRNDFRSTAFHNTPVIDRQEQNRFVRPEYLWTLKPDATPDVRKWDTGEKADLLVAAHGGYRRLSGPVTPVRSLMLDKAEHRLLIADRFEGADDHSVRIPYHLAPGIRAEETSPGLWRLQAGGQGFLLVSHGDGAWTGTLGDGWVSPSYGVKIKAPVLNFLLEGELKPLLVGLMPANGAPDDPAAWLKEAAEALPA